MIQFFKVEELNNVPAVEENKQRISEMLKLTFGDRQVLRNKHVSATEIIGKYPILMDLHGDIVSYK